MASPAQITKSLSIVAIAKGRYLYLMGGNVLAGARVISSATPIFKELDSGGVDAIGFFTLNRLRLQFWGSHSDLEEIHIDLTSDDTQMLLLALKRAQRKEVELRKLAKIGRPLVRV